MEKYLKVNDQYRWYISLEKDYTYCFLEKMTGKTWLFGERWQKTSEHVAIDFIDDSQNEPSRHLRPGLCLVGIIHGRHRRISIVEFAKDQSLKDYLLSLSDKYFQRVVDRKEKLKQAENIINNL